MNVMTERKHVASDTALFNFIQFSIETIRSIVFASLSRFTSVTFELLFMSGVIGLYMFLCSLNAAQDCFFYS